MSVWVICKWSLIKARRPKCMCCWNTSWGFSWLSHVAYTSCWMVIMNSHSTSWLWLLWLFGEKEESLKCLPAQVWSCFLNACFFILLFFLCSFSASCTPQNIFFLRKKIYLFLMAVSCCIQWLFSPLSFRNLQLNLSHFSFSYTCEIVSLLLVWMLPTFYHFLLQCYNSFIPGIILDFGLQHHCSCSLPPGLFL